jgi:xylose isomerase
MIAAQPTKEDPEVQEAFETVGVTAPAQPTPGDSESFADLLADRSASEDLDVERAGRRGYRFIGLDQLAPEQLMGAAIMMSDGSR